MSEIVKAEALEKNQDPDEDQDQAPKDPVGVVVAVFGHDNLLFANRKLDIFISHLKMKYEFRGTCLNEITPRAPVFAGMLRLTIEHFRDSCPGNSALRSGKFGT